MFPLNIEGTKVYFRDIEHKDLPAVFNWYSRVEEFGFATGVENGFSVEKLLYEYARLGKSSDEFFTGVYIRENCRLAGILKGRVINAYTSSGVWIGSIVIDTAYQRKGYGTEAVAILLCFLKTYYHINNAYLSVSDGNVKGKSFWLKQGFNVIKILGKHYDHQDSSRKALIMHKAL